MYPFVTLALTLLGLVSVEHHRSYEQEQFLIQLIVYHNVTFMSSLPSMGFAQKGCVLRSANVTEKGVMLQKGVWKRNIIK